MHSFHDFEQRNAWNKQRGIIMSELKVELCFFFFAHHLMRSYICTFHEEILNAFKVTEQTQNNVWNKGA